MPKKLLKTTGDLLSGNGLGPSRSGIDEMIIHLNWTAINKECRALPIHMFGEREFFFITKALLKALFCMKYNDRGTCRKGRNNGMQESHCK
jgi:hypothetical protein